MVEIRLARFPRSLCGGQSLGKLIFECLRFSANYWYFQFIGNINSRVFLSECVCRLFASLGRPTNGFNWLVNTTNGYYFYFGELITLTVPISMFC